MPCALHPVWVEGVAPRHTKPPDHLGSLAKPPSQLPPEGQPSSRHPGTLSVPRSEAHPSPPRPVHPPPLSWAPRTAGSLDRHAGPESLLASPTSQPRCPRHADTHTHPHPCMHTHTEHPQRYTETHTHAHTHTHTHARSGTPPGGLRDGLRLPSREAQPQPPSVATNSLQTGPGQAPGTIPGQRRTTAPPGHEERTRDGRCKAGPRGDTSAQQQAAGGRAAGRGWEGRGPTRGGEEVVAGALWRGEGPS